MSHTKALLETLRLWPKMPAGELLQRLNISRPTLMRSIKSLDGQIISCGRARRTAYALRRAISSQS